MRLNAAQSVAPVSPSSVGGSAVSSQASGRRRARFGPAEVESVGGEGEERGEEENGRYYRTGEGGKNGV